jgi:hypothetical protein
MSESEVPEIGPPTSFKVFTLNDDYTPRTHMGGAGDALGAVMIACTVATSFGVPVGVQDEVGNFVAYLALVEEQTG